MPGKFRRFRDGDALTPRSLNVILDELERLGKLSVQPPLYLKEDASGIALRCEVTSLAPDESYARSGTSGIPARTGTYPNFTPGSATDVVLLPFDGTQTDSGDTVKVLNFFAEAVGASKLMVVKWDRDNSVW